MFLLRYQYAQAVKRQMTTSVDTMAMAVIAPAGSLVPPPEEEAAAIPVAREVVLVLDAVLVPVRVMLPEVILRVEVAAPV
jgi:hypothetical protein